MQKHSSFVRKQAPKTFKNEEIKAFKILLLDENGVQVGTIPRAKALEIAQEKWLDLVQISYNAETQICTAKLIDYGKFMYDKKKNEQEKKKTGKAKEQKELKFGYTIGDNDLDLKIKKATEFLAEGHLVRMSVVLKWREKAYKHLALQKLQRVEEALQAVSKSQGIKEEIFWYVLHLFPKKH